jgi:sugar phosphate isomerase/epimerase
MKPLSIQLYTVREAAAKDFPGVLKKIAAVGYKGVEFAGLHNFKPAEIRKVLDDAGLVASSSHTALPTKDNLQELVDTAGALGYKFIITGKGPDDFKTLDGIKAAAGQFQAAAALLKGTGLALGYHNHWWEMDLVEGRLGLEWFLELAPDVFSQVDVYWATNFGAVNTAKLVRAHKKRIPILHLKDGCLTPRHPHTAVGKGRLKMGPIVKAADAKVLQWLVVELDECATDMMQAVEDSYTYLTSQGLAAGNK